MTRVIEVIPYDPAWLLHFKDAADQITTVLVSNLISAHHIGSTAVPGLAAKPIIDILLVVRSLEALDACNDAMGRLGYIAKSENGIAGRRYFQRLDGERHLVHIHAFKEGHPEITRHLNFRDYLIAHPQTAQAYQELKQKLASVFKASPQDYTAGKEFFIREVDTRAASWRADMHQVQGD
jgi:GrpB-like predicted nucleotidyltransferase (UPF0157 family)